MKRSLSFLLVFAWAALFPTAVVAQSQQAIRQKLNTIRLPEIAYEGLTLDEIAADLTAEGKRHDPEKTGVKIRVSPDQDTSQTLARLKLPMFDLSLKQALDAVVRTSSKPIEYVIKEDTVLLQRAMKPHGAKATGPATTNSETDLILKKLKQVKLPLVQYDGFTLDSVVQDLLAQTRGKGINFAFAPVRHPPPVTAGAPVLDAMGNPIAYTSFGPYPNSPGVSMVIINLRHSLTNLSLASALDVILHTADRPIEYTVESFGIVFELVSDKKHPVVTKFIPVDVNRVLAKLDALSIDAPAKKRKMVSQRLRAYLFAAGVDSMSERESRSSLFFNQENGQVLVRALKDDLPRIKQVLHRMSVPPDK